MNAARKHESEPDLNCVFDILAFLGMGAKFANSAIPTQSYADIEERDYGP